MCQHQSRGVAEEDLTQLVEVLRDIFCLNIESLFILMNRISFESRIHLNRIVTPRIRIKFPKIPTPSNQHVKLLHLPSSVSCHTMPSRLTLVPGSQGPKHSGSVARATSDVFTATERVRTIICSHGEAISLLPTVARRWRGGGAGVETGDSICGEKKWGLREREREKHMRHFTTTNTYRADVKIQPMDATMRGS